MLLMTSLSVIPLWDFEASTINLLSESSTHNYTIYQNSVCNTYWVALKKAIKKEENGISEKNFISINNAEFETSWEDIDGIYCLAGKLYICPKGKNHMNLFDSSKTFSEIIPNDFQNNNNNWELKCFWQSGSNLMFIGYLNKDQFLYSYKYNDGIWSTKTEFNNGLYDFKWTIYNVDDYYPMICIALEGDNIKLQAIKYDLRNNQISKNTIGTYPLINNIFSHSNAYFINSEQKKFYFMTYKETPPNFKSGFSLSDDIDFISISSFSSSI